MDHKLILSLKPERPHPPKLVCMHLTSIPTCINFLSRFRSIKFFDDHGLYRMSQFVGGNLCWRFLRKFTFGGFYFGDFLHLQELGVARVNNQLLLADFILAIYLSTANPPTLIPRQQIDSYGSPCSEREFGRF